MRQVLFFSLPACALLIAAVGRAGALESRAPDSDPAYRVTLHVDGVEHQLVADQEAQVTIAGRKVRTKVVVRDERRFVAAGVSFDFPRDMAFKEGDGSALASWTLDGDDCVLHVYAPGHLDAASLASSIIAQTAAALDETAKPATPCQVELGGKTYPGHRTRVTLKRSQLELTSVGLEAGGNAVVLMLQDSFDDDGRSSAEAKRIWALLAKTFVLGQAK